MTLRAMFVIAASLPAAALHAQSAPPAPTPADTGTRRPGHVLAPMMITAARRAPTLAEEGVMGRILRTDREHRQIVELMAGNRKLAAYVSWQGREIVRLEDRLSYLTTTVTDSINRATFAADSATAEVRTRREMVEARLAELETRQMAARPAESSAAGAFR